MELLPIIWYGITILALLFYSILDGFDLGVGILHLISKKDQHRRIFLNAIGPVWDGNEVWLVIIGGALFAGFPNVYATIFSAFYVPCMILLCALILRAVAIECRSKILSHTWRRSWDLGFNVASILIAFCMGVVMTNLIQGIAINQDGVFIGSFWSFFTPYTILGGVTIVSLFMMHGALYLLIKTKGVLHECIRKWAKRGSAIFLICSIVLGIATLFLHSYVLETMLLHPLFFVFPLLFFGFLITIPYFITHQKDRWGFVFSCLTITSLVILFCIGSYPIMVRSSIDPQRYSLTLFNSVSSILTLKVLLSIVAIGIPCVLLYGFYIYHVFKGKVSLDSNSY